MTLSPPFFPSNRDTAMQSDKVNEAVFECVKHAQGSPQAAANFLAGMRTDSRWAVDELDDVARLAIPIVRQFMAHKMQGSQPA